MRQNSLHSELEGGGRRPAAPFDGHAAEGDRERVLGEGRAADLRVESARRPAAPNGASEIEKGTQIVPHATERRATGGGGAPAEEQQSSRVGGPSAL